MRRDIKSLLRPIIFVSERNKTKSFIYASSKNGLQIFEFDRDRFNVWVLVHTPQLVSRNHPFTIHQRIKPDLIQLLTYKASPGNEVAMMVLRPGKTFFFPGVPAYDFMNLLSTEALSVLVKDAKLLARLIEKVRTSPFPDAARAICSQPGAEWLKEF